MRKLEAKRIIFGILLSMLLVVTALLGCDASDPLPEDLYLGEDLYVAGTLYADSIASPYARFVTVAESGGDYTSIQDAIDSITDATVAKVYAVYIYPGDYTETITGKNYVHLIGVCCKRSTVQIHGAAGTLLTTQTGSGGIFKNLDFVSTGAEVVDVPAGAAGYKFLFKNCRFKVDMTDDNLDAVTVSSGTVAFEDCRLNYTESNVGGTAGAVWHRGVYASDNCTIRIHDCNLAMEVEDDNDIVVLLDEASGYTAELFVDSTDFHIHLTNGAYTGAAGAYYTHGSGTDRQVLSCHIHIETDGGGLGYAYFLDSVAGGGEIHSTANYILVNGFVVANGYLAAAAAGDEICCTFDDVSGSDAGYKHSGNVDIIVGSCGTFSCDGIVTENINASGKIEGDRLVGDIEGYSVDVVQASDMGIALNDTLSLVFAFEPDVIVLDFSGRCLHDTTFEVGHSTGHCLITVIAVDTINYNTNVSTLIDNNGAIGTWTAMNDVVFAVMVWGGHDGVDIAYFVGAGTWTTATHTLLITFSSVISTDNGTNFVEIIATAYR